MDQFPEAKFTTEGIAYYTFGQGRTTLMLVHGSFGSALMWQKLIPYFIQASFRVVALDLEGHGKSRNFDLTKSTMDSYANNIKSVLRSIGGQVVLVGHSMAGLLVLMVAAELAQIEKIVAIDPSPSKEIQGIGSTEGIPDIYNPIQAGMPADLQGMMTTMPDVDPLMFPMMAKMLGPESGTARRQRKMGISLPKEKLEAKQVLFLGAEYGDSLEFGISAASTKKMAQYYHKPYFEVAGASHPGMLLGKSSDEVAKKILEWLGNTI